MPSVPMPIRTRTDTSHSRDRELRCLRSARIKDSHITYAVDAL